MPRLEPLGKRRKEFGRAEGPKGRASGGERVNVAVDKGAHVIPWNEVFASLNKLRKYIQTLSDHMPVVSRFYFTDAAGD
jgi:hypothetical protein